MRAAGQVVVTPPKLPLPMFTFPLPVKPIAGAAALINSPVKQGAAGSNIPPENTYHEYLATIGGKRVIGTIPASKEAQIFCAGDCGSSGGDEVPSIPPSGSSAPPPPDRNPKEFLERTAAPDGEISLLKEAMQYTKDGIDWVKMVRLGRAGNSAYSELADRPLVKKLGEIVKTVMVPKSDNFTSPERTPWGGRRILDDLKSAVSDIGAFVPHGIIGESWEISSHKKLPSLFKFEYVGESLEVSLPILDKIFSEEIYGQKISEDQSEGMPFLVKILNSGSWQPYRDELKNLFLWLDSQDYVAGWRKSLGADNSFTEILEWNYYEIHHALSHLKTMMAKRILSAADEHPNAVVWRQNLGVSSLENLSKGKNVYEFMAALHFLAAMFPAGGFADKVHEANYLIRLYNIHQKMLTKNLSVRVHPSKAYDGLTPDEHPKSEAWIILDAEPGAGIYLGFKEGVNKEQFYTALRVGEDITNSLNFIKVKAGDVFFIPAGTMHAIGAGILLMEPQETSEATFRVYDYGRVDASGKPRPLKIDSAVAVTDWDGKKGEDAVEWYRRTPEVINPGDPHIAKVERILNEHVFETSKLSFIRGADYKVEVGGSVKAYTVVEGAVGVFKKDEESHVGEYIKGQSFIVPAAMGAFKLKGVSEKATVFETSVYSPFAVGKPTSSISEIIAKQPLEMQARNSAFIARPSRGHILMINTQGYAGPKVPRSAPDTGGQIVYIHYKARMLARMGYKLTIATRSFKPDEEYAVYGDRKGVDFLPGTGDMVRYLFVPGLQVKDAPFYYKEQKHFYSDLPSIARNLSFFINEEAKLQGVDPWNYFLFLDSHYVDGGIVGQRLVRIWDHMFVNEYLKKRFGAILEGQPDPDPFAHDNIMGALAYHFGNRVLTAWREAQERKPVYGAALDVEEVLKWAAEKQSWSQERFARLLGNAMGSPAGNGKDLAQDGFKAFTIGYRLLEAADEWRRLPRMIKDINHHVWTPHSLGQLKEDHKINDGTWKKPDTFHAYNFPNRIAAEKVLLSGSMSGSDDIYQGMPPAKVVVLTSGEIAETAMRQGMPATKATISFVPGTNSQEYHPRGSINDPDVQDLFEDMRQRGVVSADVASQLMDNPQGFNIIVEAGRMDSSKRKHMLVEAMADLPSDTILFITGKKDREGVYDDLKARIEKHGLQDRVFLLGLVPDELMGPLMSLPHGENDDQFRLAIVASASSMEGWGMAVEDGTRGGLPLVASDNTPYALHLEKTSKAAIVIPSGDNETEEIARYVQALKSLIENPPMARQMASKALPIAQQYEWGPLTENFMAQLSGLLLRTPNVSHMVVAGGSLATGQRHEHVIMLAGSPGTGFEPYSTNEMPKQFLKLTHRDGSMLQVTAARFKGVVPSDNIWVAANARHIDLVREQVPDIPQANIMGEPVQRNTAPTIATLMYWIARQDPNATVLIVPSNHFIASTKIFLGQVDRAFEYAALKGGLVTFGIKPAFASTDNDYLEVGGRDPSYNGVYRVRRFVERPKGENAHKYVEAENYLWNSGMFVWSAPTFLRNLEHYQPVMYAGLNAVYGGNTMALSPTPEMMFKFFAPLNPISIDHALMEPASLDNGVFVIPFETAWSDVGTWKGLERLVREKKVEPPEEVLAHMKEQLAAWGK